MKGKGRALAKLETYYLVDFENVHEEGLSGSDRLGAHDHIHIFSTQYAPKISFKELALLNSTEHFSHVVPAGRQSLDMHLIAYLGYLIGEKRNCRYVIVSKDTDFDHVISFFKKDISPNADITRRTRIDAAPHSDNGDNSNIGDNAEIKKILTQADFGDSVVSYVTSLIAKHGKKVNAKQTIYKALVKKYGQESGGKLYNQIKSCIKK